MPERAWLRIRLVRGSNAGKCPVAVLRRIGSLIAVGVTLSLLLAGCPSPQELAGAGETGCHQEYAGVMGITLPETSRLSCAAINNLNSSMPAEPETYLERGDSPRLLWKCKFYGVEAPRVLFRCEHEKRHFSIVKKL